MEKILIIEDEFEIADFLKECLCEKGYLVTIAGDGIDGISKFNESTCDLILLDIMLPKMDGYAVCELIRKTSDIPIIMLTAMDTEQDEIRGFDVFADDYISKPFSVNILYKRIEAALRKKRSRSSATLLKSHGITLNLDSREVFSNGAIVSLTQIEFVLLHKLMANRGKVVVKDSLLAFVWDLDEPKGADAALRYHMMNLRKKLKTDVIKTVRGVGYKIG